MRASFLLIAVLMLAACSSSVSSPPPSAPPPRSSTYAMSIHSKVFVGGLKFEIGVHTLDVVCMSEPPPDYIYLEFDDTWKGTIAPDLKGNCENYPGSFKLHIDSQHNRSAEENFTKGPTTGWETYNKVQRGLCIVKRGSVLDVGITAPPLKGRCP